MAADVMFCSPRLKYALSCAFGLTRNRRFFKEKGKGRGMHKMDGYWQ
jgi:hypothetical protein